MIKTQLARILQTPALSPNLSEMVSRMLGAG
jgi:hypothetical protein